MNKQCENIQNQVLDYILGILEQEKIDAFNKHISECRQCRDYMKSLENENKLLVRFGESLETNMQDKQAKAINAMRFSKHSPNDLQ